MTENTDNKGVIYGILAFLIWGLLPLYWKLLEMISPFELVTQRVVWSFILMAFLLIIKGKWNDFVKMLTNKEQIKIVTASALMVSINWFVYIWSVNNHYILEASLGYYLNPLALTVLGALFLKERMSLLQRIGVMVAFAGVLIKTVYYGSLPLISIILAVSFAIYGFIKKKSNLDAMTSLAFETLVVGVPSLFYVIYMETMGYGIAGNLPFYYWFIMALSGIATATPLLLYAESAQRIPLYLLGVIQYLSPTISFLLGIFVFKEVCDFSTGLVFVFVIAGVIIFSLSQFKVTKKRDNRSYEG